MQEDIENRTVALSVKTAKLTARSLAAVLAAAWRQIQNADRKTKNNITHGRQSVKELMKQGSATSTIPLNGDTRLFDKVARKWNVDYSFHKTGHKKYLLLFKSGQADAITACFSEYTRRYMKRAQDRRLPALEVLRQNAERVRTNPLEQERNREAVRDER